MSIRDAINGHDGSELFCVESAFFGEETPRYAYYSKEVGEFAFWDDGDDHQSHLGRNAAALLDHFIEGGHIEAAMDPYNKAPCTMARVDSPDSRYDIWDIRCLDPKPGARVLGAFAEKDCFIALTWDFRENFDDQWPEKIQECILEWRRLFGSTLPFRGSDLEDYISEPYSAC